MKISMADITNKSIMHREAIAYGKINLREETIKKIKNKQIKKGDPIQISIIAGINAAKMTSQLMPLCHNIGIEEINITPTIKKTHIELLARVKAILRRVNMESENSVIGNNRNLEKPSGVLVSGNLVLDTQRHKVSLNEIELDLKPREFQLLFLFMSNIGLVLSRNKILDELWGQEFIGDSRSVDVHVRWLRVKLEDDSSHPKRLITIRGAGYRFEG